MTAAPTAEYRAAYAAHRAAEGRGLTPEAARTLPYLAEGPLANQWQVRARTYEAFMRGILLPIMKAEGITSDHFGSPAARAKRSDVIGRDPLRLLDLGAGNGWLSWRAASVGCECVALDIRDDDVDGLGAAMPYLDDDGTRFERVAASFEQLPIASDTFDVVVFDASLHYASDLAVALGEARRVVRRGGKIVVLDSPFYRRAADGEAMVAEKRRDGERRFGADAGVLLGTPCIEYLTRERLMDASTGLALAWRRRRVRYPLWYEVRPLVARLRGRRVPSRFDLWEGMVA